MHASVRKLALALAILSLAPAANAACYDLSKSEPRELSGRMDHRIFAGPPNYEDVRKGDTPEPGYVLMLDKPICLTGDEFADPASPFSEVQLVEGEDTAGMLARFKKQEVRVSLRDPMAASTGHHHRPLVAWVTSVEPQGDVTDEYGNAASAVRAFYYALAAGDGETAAAFVVAEKRTSGPLSAHALTRFYGNLSRPLELDDLHASGPDRYTVSYSYKAGKRACNGKALVTTVARNDSFFIRSIKALNGC